MGTINLTKSLFLTNVADYVHNPNQWKFLGNKPAMIDFYATWCGPCKAFAPVLEKVASKYAGKIDIYKVDVDKEEELSQLFGIRSIPTLVFIPMEGNPTRIAGAMPQAQLESMLNDLIK